MVLTACFVLSLVSRAFLPPSPVQRVSVVTALISASGYQDHMTSPSASSAFVLRAVSIHRIPPPTSVTIAKRPSEEAGPNRYSSASTKQSSEIRKIRNQPALNSTPDLAKSLPVWSLEARPEPTPSTGKLDNRYFRDCPATGHIPDIPTSTQMTRWRLEEAKEHPDDQAGELATG